MASVRGSTGKIVQPNYRTEKTMRFSNSLAYILFASFLGLIQGCTVIGMGIGGIADSRSDNKGYLETGNLGSGENRYFYLRDGTVIEGTFICVDTLNDKEYATIKMNLQDSLLHYLATSLIGDTLLSMDTVVIEKINYEYSHQAVRLDIFNGSQFLSLNTRSTRDERQINFKMSDIEKLTLSNGKTITKLELMNLVDAGLLPLKSRVIINYGGVNKPIALNNIEKTSRVKTHNGLLIGAMVGLPIDILIAIAAAHAISNMNLLGDGGF